MNGGIVYYSTYGSTRQYAEWIAERTGFRLIDQRTEEVPWDELDTVVIGSPALKMEPFLKSWIIERWPRLESKRVILYTTSGAPPTTPALHDGFNAAFPPEIRDHIEYMPVHGRLIWKELKPLHRLLMRIGKMLEKDPARKRQMLEDVDGVSESLVEPIVAALQAV